MFTSLLLNDFVILLRPNLFKNLERAIFNLTSKGFSSKIPALLKSTKFCGFNKVATFPP